MLFNKSLPWTYKMSMELFAPNICCHKITIIKYASLLENVIITENIIHCLHFKLII